MRTTALLILLVVLVSTGEALQCNTLDGGTEECSTSIYNACVHYKSDDEEYKSCGIQEECTATEGDESEHPTVLCCSEDLCN
uniref:Plethodontid modulating factor n=1 Tax=Plethodon websteri TaxID=255929 RepID=Q0GAH0_9SALA|nr:plethodontid modulating factor [Plethodon websteri]ABI48792.1 plethodontid modulating factor [Plethodon websteri]ABI48793.1 plethodontid modulating factor [Plethodon websteri]ABI48795.1 plethodontid modulating factor [Plethodon websteri]ABI48796.1 plethodontid modulating factor [Plethodon websteri]